MPLSNEELITLVQKANIDTATGGQVSPENVVQFVNLMQGDSEFLQNVRVESDIINERTIDGLEFGGPVMQKAPASGSKPNANAIVVPTMPRLTLKPQKTMIATNISFDWLRKNVAGENVGEEQLNAALAKAAGLDVADLLMNGDADLDDSTPENRLLNIADGILKRARADVNVNDVVMAANPVFAAAGSEFSKTLASIPSKYRRDRSMIRHFVPMNILDAYEDELGARQTTAGDAAIVGSSDITRHKKVKLVEVPGMPDNIILTSNYSNIVVGFGRNMKMFREIDAREQIIKLTIITDLDFGFVWGEPIALSEKA